MSRKYAWKTAGFKPSGSIDAQDAGEELERIEAEHGVVSPRVIVNESVPDAAVLHKAFTWDDYKCGILWRDEEARNIVQAIRVVAEEDNKPCEERIAYVHVSMDDSSGYLSTARVFRDEDLREQVLRDAESLLKSIRDRFKELSELQDVFCSIDKFLAERKETRTQNRERSAMKSAARNKKLTKKVTKKATKKKKK